MSYAFPPQSLIQERPDSLILGGVDAELEAKKERKRKRDEAFEKQQIKERSRVEAEAASKRRRLDVDFDDNDDNSNDDENDEEADDSDDSTYYPSTHGHRRTRKSNVTLNLNVKQFRKKFSALADHRHLSSTTRSDIVTLMVTEGGESLANVPSAQRTMIK